MRTDPVPADAASTFVDRRRHDRYRFSAPITVYPKGHAAIRGMSLEISASGMSALISESLPVGDTVELEPVVGDRVSALIRRHSGRIYGFEFLNLTSAQTQRIEKQCEALPKYQSKTLDI